MVVGLDGCELSLWVEEKNFDDGTSGWNVRFFEK